MYMLDASALLALMLGETGADTVYDSLPRARISAVNLSEVVAKLQERGVPDPVISSSLAEFDLAAIPFDRDQAMRAGLLRAPTRRFGLSLGDRACLAAAAATGATALTTDRIWSNLDVGVAVEIAR
jgi:PIN domain nuclease of toxin-antitoxin system